MNQCSPKDVPLNLLRGLQDIIMVSDYDEKTESILSSLFDNCFGKWLLKYVNLLEQAAEQNSVFGDDPPFDEFLSLLSVALDLCAANRELFRVKKLSDHLVKIVKHSLPQHARYKSVLVAMRAICLHAPDEEPR